MSQRASTEGSRTWVVGLKPCSIIAGNTVAVDELRLTCCYFGCRRVS